MRETYECVGIGTDDSGVKHVVVSTELQDTWLTPAAAKTLAVQLMVCAEAIELKNGNPPNIR